MDALDLNILVTLDADARRSHADVAREFGVSQPTVADRIRRLESRGIVRGAMLRGPSRRIRRRPGLVPDSSCQTGNRGPFLPPR